MSVTTVRPTDAIRSDFADACAELAEAKRAWRAKDTPAARARVAECARRVDAILDMSNGAVRRGLTPFPESAGPDR